MSISAIEMETPRAIYVKVSENALIVDLSDGRTIAVPLDWYPRLKYAGEEERKNWRLIGKGQGIHWEEIDEDISISGLLAGNPSAESQASLKKWLQERSTQKAASSGREPEENRP